MFNQGQVSGEHPFEDVALYKTTNFLGTLTKSLESQPFSNRKLKSYFKQDKCFFCFFKYKQCDR